MNLSGREHQTLELLAQGLSNKEIGGKLEPSPFTVKNHSAAFSKVARPQSHRRRDWLSARQRRGRAEMRF